MLGLIPRRILLGIHILLNSTLVGGFAAIVYLNLIKKNAGNAEQLYAFNWTIFKIHDNIIIYVASGVIITGMLFSLFTKWGFFDFYWIIAKWLSLALLFFLIISYLGPSVNAMAALSDVERSQVLNNPLYLEYQRSTTLFASIILLILCLTIFISVFKPWGKRKKPFKTNRKIVLTTGSVLGLLALIGFFIQSGQLQSYRNMTIKDFHPASIVDGSYVGEAQYGFNYRVKVEIKEHQIAGINVIENRNSIYAKWAEGVVKKVLRKQTANVDAVSGATTTSKILLKAIENAIEKGQTR